MEFTKIPENTFSQLQLNAGVIAKSFTPSSKTVGDLLAATTGGIQFTATPSFVDMGEDVDNCPKNTKELKKLDTWEITMSGTFVTISTASAKMLMAAADIDSSDTSKVTPRNDLKESDFGDIWWVGDYANAGDSSKGFVAIHMKNALNTGGFQLKSADKEKGQFAFEFTAHYSAADTDDVPFEVYIAA